jgi:hypothetical protein
MSFRSRVILLCVIIAALVAALVLGILMSPDRVQARSSGRSLLSVSPDQIVGIDIMKGGSVEVSLGRQQAGWRVAAGSVSYPASAPRIAAFLRTVSALARGTLVTRDAGHFAELGVVGADARRLVLHRTGGLAAVGLSVGRRGPSGDEDYVLPDGEAGVSLVRGSLGFFLSQERPSWYELHVLPDDVQGTTISSVSVKGGLTVDGTVQGTIDGPYTLVRGRSGQAVTWSIPGEKRPVNGPAAAAMVSSLALLEGVDFAVDGLPPSGPAGGVLFCDVATLAGRSYSLVIKPGSRPGTLTVTTSWSPWTYVVNALPLQRALLARDALLAKP